MKLFRSNYETVLNIIRRTYKIKAANVLPLLTTNPNYSKTCLTSKSLLKKIISEEHDNFKYQYIVKTVVWYICTNLLQLHIPLSWYFIINCFKFLKLLNYLFRIKFQYITLVSIILEASALHSSCSFPSTWLIASWPEGAVLAKTVWASSTEPWTLLKPSSLYSNKS